MKKILTIFAAAVAALTLASCNKDDSVYENNNAIAQELKVNAYLDEPATKATNEVIRTTTDSLATFKMFAYSDGNEVIGGQKYTKKDGSWTTGNVYYWNSVGKYDFFAIAEDNAYVDVFSAGTTAMSKDGLAVTGYEVAKSGKQVDPVYAAIYAATAPTDGKIDLAFQHILSRVRVEPDITIDNNVMLKAKVLSWEFRGVGTKGYFTASKEADKLSWATDVTGNVTNDYEEGKVSWNNVIPGESVVETLVLKVEFSDMNDVKIKDRYFTVAKKDITNAVTEYKQGIQYTYKLTVKNDGGKDTDGNDPDSELIKIVVNNVTVEPWHETKGGEFTFQEKAN